MEKVKFYVIYEKSKINVSRFKVNKHNQYFDSKTKLKWSILKHVMNHSFESSEENLIIY